ncbi:MAG TPA: hypothetical protein QGF70_04390 [Candidatus Thalassarchaeaceae archaeon]|jgi:hypothetical protein|nr:hypothetical protein [Candidatus Thalassarchaeaceae archaeon]HJL64807.1 hypothetical protein [Candidatus Thalassarchaeaceae archaeon]HJO42274.1 hypothetical protein [Candidatus Thalassarchaeaceae archaeon]
MVLGEVPMDDSVSSPQQGLAAAAKEDLPSNDALELMESILQRLQPADRHEIRDMITQRGWLSGALLMMSALFWWIAVKKGGDSLGDADIPLSMLGEFDFSSMALIVPGLVFIASVIWSLGRERGLASAPSLAGLLVILAVYYTLEPIGFAILTDHIDFQSAIIATGRLLALAVMIHYSARLFIDSILLQWVRTQMINMPVELIPSMSGSSTESHTDEVGPSA